MSSRPDNVNTRKYPTYGELKKIQEARKAKSVAVIKRQDKVVKDQKDQQQKEKAAKEKEEAEFRAKLEANMARYSGEGQCRTCNLPLGEDGDCHYAHGTPFIAEKREIPALSAEDFKFHLALVARRGPTIKDDSDAGSSLDEEEENDPLPKHHAKSVAAVARCATSMSQDISTEAWFASSTLPA